MPRRIEYVVCPCCGKNKMISFSSTGDLNWVDYDPKTMEFIQIREGGGKVGGDNKKGRGQARGVGFPKVDSMTLEDAMVAGGEELATARAIAQRLIEVTKEFKRLGLMP